MYSNNALDQFLEDDLAFLKDYAVTNRFLLVRLFFWMLAYEIFMLIKYTYSLGDKFTHSPTTSSLRLEEVIGG